MEELSLKWDEHHPAVISVFEQLLSKGTLVDCTIAADGQYVKAHKVVLAACSPYFEMLFSQENEKNPIVVLKDMKFQELKYLIDFVYRGQVKLPEDRLDAFVSAAESLQIKGLSGHHKRQITQRSANKTVASRESCSSPVPRKRRRNSRTEPSEDSRSEPGNESSSDSNMHENFISTPMSLGVPSTSASSSSTGIAPHSVSTQQTQDLAETRFPSHDQLSPSPEQVLPDVPAVVKTEPEEQPTEPVSEVFLSEPKNEEYVDDLAMLECGAGSSESHGGTSQQNMNNYPGHDSTRNNFLMNETAHQNTGPGAASPSRSKAAAFPPSPRRQAATARARVTAGSARTARQFAQRRQLLEKQHLRRQKQRPSAAAVSMEERDEARSTSKAVKTPKGAPTTSTIATLIPTEVAAASTEQRNEPRRSKIAKMPQGAPVATSPKRAGAIASMKERVEPRSSKTPKTTQRAPNSSSTVADEACCSNVAKTPKGATTTTTTSTVATSTEERGEARRSKGVPTTASPTRTVAVASDKRDETRSSKAKPQAAHTTITTSTPPATTEKRGVEGDEAPSSKVSKTPQAAAATATTTTPTPTVAATSASTEKRSAGRDETRKVAKSQHSAPITPKTSPTVDPASLEDRDEAHSGKAGKTSQGTPISPTPAVAAAASTEEQDEVHSSKTTKSPQGVQAVSPAVERRVDRLLKMWSPVVVLRDIAKTLPAAAAVVVAVAAAAAAKLPEGKDTAGSTQTEEAPSSAQTKVAAPGTQTENAAPGTETENVTPGVQTKDVALRTFVKDAVSRTQTKDEAPRILRANAAPGTLTENVAPETETEDAVSAPSSVVSVAGSSGDDTPPQSDVHVDEDVHYLQVSSSLDEESCVGDSLATPGSVSSGLAIGVVEVLDEAPPLSAVAPVTPPTPPKEKPRAAASARSSPAARRRAASDSPASEVASLPPAGDTTALDTSFDGDPPLTPWRVAGSRERKTETATTSGDAGAAREQLPRPSHSKRTRSTTPRKLTTAAPSSAASAQSQRGRRWAAKGDEEVGPPRRKPKTARKQVRRRSEAMTSIDADATPDVSEQKGSAEADDISDVPALSERPKSRAQSAPPQETAAERKKLRKGSRRITETPTSINATGEGASAPSSVANVCELSRDHSPSERSDSRSHSAPPHETSEGSKKAPQKRSRRKSEAVRSVDAAIGEGVSAQSTAADASGISSGRPTSDHSYTCSQSTSPQETSTGKIPRKKSRKRYESVTSVDPAIDTAGGGTLAPTTVDDTSEESRPQPPSESNLESCSESYPPQDTFDESKKAHRKRSRGKSESTTPSDADAAANVVGEGASTVTDGGEVTSAVPPSAPSDSRSQSAPPQETTAGKAPRKKSRKKSEAPPSDIAETANPNPSETVISTPLPAEDAPGELSDKSDDIPLCDLVSAGSTPVRETSVASPLNFNFDFGESASPSKETPPENPPSPDCSPPAVFDAEYMSVIGDDDVLFEPIASPRTEVASGRSSAMSNYSTASLWTETCASPPRDASGQYTYSTLDDEAPVVIKRKTRRKSGQYVYTLMDDEDDDLPSVTRDSPERSEEPPVSPERWWRSRSATPVAGKRRRTPSRSKTPTDRKALASGWRSADELSVGEAKPSRGRRPTGRPRGRPRKSTSRASSIASRSPARDDLREMDDVWDARPPNSRGRPAASTRPPPSPMAALFPSSHVCGTCGSLLGSAADLRRHMLDKHPLAAFAAGLRKIVVEEKQQQPQREQQKLHCRVCRRPFIYEASLRSHEKGHARGRTHGCVTCGERFITAAELRAHVTHTHEDDAGAEAKGPRHRKMATDQALD